MGRGLSEIGASFFVKFANVTAPIRVPLPKRRGTGKQSIPPYLAPRPSKQKVGRTKLVHPTPLRALMAAYGF